jgi:hypothetical protein
VVVRFLIWLGRGRTNLGCGCHWFCSFCLGILGVAVSSRKRPELNCYRVFLDSLGVLTWRGGSSKDPSDEFSALVYAFGVLSREPPGCVSGWYRAGGHEFAHEPVEWAYVARCMGHRLDRGLVRRFPRLLPVCALVFEGGRWPWCESVVSGDHGACYLYACALGGRLPVPMHNRLLLEGGSEFARRYISDFCGML